MIVDVLIPCYIDQVFPDTAHNMIKVLETLGCGVNYNPNQTCCGHPAFINGFWDECKPVGEKLIKEFQNERYIVCPSSMCTGMVKNNYQQLFHNSSLHNEYKSVQKNMYEFSDFLVNVLNVSNLNATFAAKAVYLHSCKAVRELNIKQAPVTLLNNVKELELIELNDDYACCGYDMAFTNQMEEISVAIARRKIETIKATGAQLIISADYTCLMHLGGVIKKDGLDIKCMHIADVLAVNM
ncbi:MAG TPA: (Fe-S)-binding protein [Bacteroidia bacterium]|nr:(Fe-S)-binding protein [Bacteroidia bacterium]HNU33282.1 (Fe-S)-binding protein [Bacteroidia bacterium]